MTHGANRYQENGWAPKMLSTLQWDMWMKGLDFSWPNECLQQKLDYCISRTQDKSYLITRCCFCVHAKHWWLYLCPSSKETFHLRKLPFKVFIPVYLAIMGGELKENYNRCVYLQLAFRMNPGTRFINELEMWISTMNSTDFSWKIPWSDQIQHLKVASKLMFTQLLQGIWLM